MKFAKKVGLVILIISAVNAVPVEEVQKEQKDAKDEIVEISLNHEVEDNTIVHNLLHEMSARSSAIAINSFWRFWNNYGRMSALRQGSTIGLQSFVRNHWVSCDRTPCGRQSCPRSHMTGNDWINCYGEVFRIYRAKGPGKIRVGDRVGLYYPRDRTWIGCAGHKCGKAPCPGYPSTTHGFATPHKWYGCWGEVFRIYAKNKRFGATINSHDYVAFYYVRGRNWLSLGYGNLVKKPCLGTSRPPPLSKYDGCIHETFRVWKK